MTGYADRRAAGCVLAGRVAAVVPMDEPVTVLGLPRGGVPVAAEIARRLNAPLDAFAVRKLGAPGQPEFALGAIATGGTRVVNAATVLRLGLADAEVEAIAEREATELARRERAYRDGRPPPAITGRTVVLVDDGLATGATMVAAARAARREAPARLVAAVPVASPEGADMVRAEVDEFVCPLTPEHFAAVGQFYDNFAATSDDEVHDLLLGAQASARR
ncbi:phosphoribosyltransferase [Frankia sp. CNm7]|uniref:Phosphoribosyltransferase n=1 Tax=Frankia nepalensis TaxID=1836974 RepID=A0A937USQ7_9ACTN|nr:phosphoribosyltransferase family protein [Frankia nepalensis]MBL7499585.1 phosphoribosyltransferase [Frankia nepalensis]MBL7513074.1 phosphoribosyltransferase [Frankia nepalensis]MBL7522910.1 phosphoribosyltransferase [Frankia nepalensis]MBL7632368.1 phosphoribosyltransferase [Frankia nepalensis]